MNVGALRIEMHLADAFSLKDKRKILSMIKDRVKNKFNASIAEVDEMDKWQKAVIGVSVVSNDKKHLYSYMDKIVDFLESYNRVRIIDYTLEVL